MINPYESSNRKSCESNIFTDEITNESSEFSNKYHKFQNSAKTLYFLIQDYHEWSILCLFSYLK